MKIKAKRIGYFFLGLIISLFNGGGQFSKLSKTLK